MTDVAADSVIRVLIVDDHQMMAEGIQAALEGEADIEVVGVAGTAADAVTTAIATTPDVVLMDFRLPDRDGSQATLDVRAAVPGVAVVMLTGFGDDATLTRAIDAGCSGFVHKSADIEDRGRRRAPGPGR